MAASMTGMSEEEYREMMVAAGAPSRATGPSARTATRSRTASRRAAASRLGALTWRASPRPSTRATCPRSARPSITARPQEPYWQPLFAGYQPSRRWFAEHTARRRVAVYNDHASAFSLDLIPTFAIGTAAEFHPADEGWGPEPGPDGRRAPGARRAHRAERDPGRLRSDHREPDGRRSWPDGAAQPDVRAPRRLALPRHPFAVNVVHYPVPSGRRCFQLGQAHPPGIEATTSRSTCRSGARAA